MCISKRCRGHFIQAGSDCLSSSSGGGGSAASHLLPFSQHVGLCVCEDSSCILRSRSRGIHLPLSPRSPSSELLLPSSNINGCWFFNEEVGVPVQRVRRGLARGGGGIEEKGEGEEMYWCKTHPPAEELKRKPSRVGLREKRGRKGMGGGAHTVNIAMPSVSLQRDKQANCSILPLMLHSEQAVCTIITGRHVYSHYKVK